jgi:hypothetical protein
MDIDKLMEAVNARVMTEEDLEAHEARIDAFYKACEPTPFDYDLVYNI